MTERFLDSNTINANLTFIEAGGKTLNDMVWTRKPVGLSKGGNEDMPIGPRQSLLDGGPNPQR